MARQKLVDFLLTVDKQHVSDLVDILTDFGKGRGTLSATVKNVLISAKESNRPFTKKEIDLLLIEFQKYGGNTFANMVRSKNSLVSYHEILDDVFELLLSVGNTSQFTDEEKEQKIVSEKTEKKQPIITGQSSQKNKNGKEKVKINNATPTFTPTTTVVEKRELTPEEIKRAKKALKEARANYFSGNKAAKLSKSSKSTDKIIIKSDSKGNVEAIRQTKEQNDKAQKILKEIRESYYKDKKK